MDSNPVKHNEEQGQFEIAVGHDKAFLQYHRTPHVMSLIHTEVPESLRGRGLGSQLIRAALDFAHFHQLKIVPVCQAVKRYLEKHPEATT
jgi:predicted GNAT family acetyltransferase